MMEKKGAWRIICLALLHTVLAAVIWYLIRQGVFQESDGKLSVLFLVISAVAALGLDALACIVLFFRPRSLTSRYQRVGALVFLLIHSLFLAGLWWMEATGKLATASGSVNVTKLVMVILAILILDAVALLLPFPSKRGTAAKSENEQQKPPASPVNDLPKIPTVFNTPKKQEEQQAESKKSGVEPSDDPQLSTPETIPSPKRSPFDRLNAFENDLRGSVATDKTRGGAESPAEITVKRKEEQPVATPQAKAEKTRFDKPVPKATVFDEGAASKATVFDEGAASKATVFDEGAASKATVFDEGAAPKATVFEDSPAQKATVFENSTDYKATLMDEAPVVKATVFEQASGRWDTIVDVSQEAAPKEAASQQWAPRNKACLVREEEPEGSVLPDITQLIPPKEHTGNPGESGSTTGTLVYNEGGMNLRINLKDGETRLGSKKAKVDYVLNSEHISRLHAVFTRQENEFYVRDAHSTNGTFLNGSETPIPSDVNVPIHNGDSVTLANMTFRFYTGKPGEN